MRLVDFQRQLRELGTVRIGYSTPGKDGNKVPHKADTFIVTAPDAETLQVVATALGGTVEPWTEGGRDRFKVVTEARAINVMVIAGMALDQCLEQYRNGFCTVRCDGATCWTPGRGRLKSQPCQCDPDNRACQLTSHLRVLMPDVPSLGTWRLVTGGFYAGSGLLGTVEFIEASVAPGTRVPGRLLLVPREVRRLVDGKPQVRKFNVPELDLSLAALAPAPSGGRALDAGPGDGAAVGWKPVNEERLPPAPFVTVADQLAEVERKPAPRRGAAPPLASTGTRPRTAAEAMAATPNCDVCGLPYGTAQLVPNPVNGGSRFVHKDCANGGTEAPEVPAPQPGPEGHARDGGGLPDDPDASPSVEAVEPAPVTGHDSAPQESRPAPTGYVRMATPAQHSKIMATAAEVWPCEGCTGPEADAYRRERLMALAAVLGHPGLTSRTQLTLGAAQGVIDALGAMKGGELALTDAGLVDAATGEVVVAS